MAQLLVGAGVFGIFVKQDAECRQCLVGLTAVTLCDGQHVQGFHLIVVFRPGVQEMLYL